MATYIKSTNCGGGCGCEFGVEVEPNDDFTFDVTGLFCWAHDVQVDIDPFECYFFAEAGGGFNVASRRIEIYANAVLIYDSGCVHAGITTNVTVPAGTTSLRIVNTYDCAGQCESGGDGSPIVRVDCV